MDNNKFNFQKLDSLPELIDEENNNSKKQFSNELPSFDDEKNDSFDDLDIPKPPKELRSKTEYKRMQDIEDEYLDTEVTNEDIDASLGELKSFSKKSSIFVNVEDYASLIETVKGTKPNFKIFQERFENLDIINDTKINELENLNKIFENLQRRIIAVDNHLFEKEEE